MLGGVECATNIENSFWMSDNEIENFRQGHLGPAHV